MSTHPDHVVLTEAVPGSDIPVHLMYVPTIDGLYAPIGLRRPPGGGRLPVILLASGNGGGGMPWVREAVRNRGYIMERLLGAGYAVAWLRYRAEVELGYHKGGRLVEDIRQGRHAPPEVRRTAMRLKDKVIIITGGATGIGRAYGLGAAAEGARVVVADVADPKPTVQEIEARGAQALGVQCDVSRAEDTQRLATATLARFGRIDVLVNNAAIYGTLQRRPFMEIPLEEWDRVMAVNLRGLFLCARAVFPAMKAQGKGKIINIASSTFFKGVPDYIHYTTSKGGVVGFTRSLARELGDVGIRVNAIAPGFTLSGENEKNISEERKQANIQMRMLKRAEVPEDVVGTLIFLASDDSDFITGQTLLVDGGGSVH